MAKLKNNLSGGGRPIKPPSLAGGLLTNQVPKTAIPKDTSRQLINSASSVSGVRSLSFGSLHTRAAGSAGSSSWTSILSAATSGGGSSFLGGGLLSGGAIGFVSKLLGLFGGHKTTPVAPTPFVLPASQATSLNIGLSGVSGPVSLGVQAHPSATAQTGTPYQHSSSLGVDQAVHSSQVVQIVKQALLTSSSLNDVISEI